jgi:hypothetical protein
MEGGLGKALLIVVVVLGADAAGIYAMAVSGAQARAGGFEEDVQPQTSAASVKKPAGEDQPFAYKPEPKESDSRPPVEQPPPAKIKAPAKAAPQESFDPLLGERFNEAELAGPPPEVGADGSPVGPGTETADRAKIDAQTEKMKQRLSKKIDRIANNMRLDPRLREDLLAISTEGLERVSEIRKGYAGGQMTDSERQYMSDQVRTANAETGESIRRLLGDEQFKQFRKESRYYDQPTERVLDKMKDLEKQNRDLQKKVDNQSKNLQKLQPQPDTGTRRSSTRRGWQRGGR